MSAPNEFDGTAPYAMADAALQAVVLTALRQAVHAPEDGRGAAGRVAQRAREFGDVIAAAAATVAGELNTPGTPAELLAEAHLRGVVHHTREYLRASAESASETGEDPDAVMRRALRMVHRLACEAEPPQGAP